MSCLHKLLCAIRNYETNNPARLLRAAFKDDSLHDAGAIPQNKCPQKLVYKRLRHRNACEVDDDFLPRI